MKALLTLIAALFFVANVSAGEFADISITELKKAIEEKKVVILDANGTDSYKAGHIPTAIDFETAGGDLAKSLPADKSTLVVAYCGNPQCNAYASAAKAAAKLGYTNVKHFSGGKAGWKKAGEKFEAAK